jgi:hypothetical protein
VPAKTFHAAALSQLTVLGEMEVDLLEAKTGLLWRIRNELPKEHREQHLGELAGEIQRAKSNRVTPDRYLDSLEGRLPPLPAELMQRVYAEYESRKRAARKLDFEDLLELAIRMYESDGRALERFRARYRAITVDEYQDVNLLLPVVIASHDHVEILGKLETDQMRVDPRTWRTRHDRSRNAPFPCLLEIVEDAWSQLLALKQSLLPRVLLAEHRLLIERPNQLLERRHGAEPTNRPHP